jgi:hypothetical protein
VLERIDGMHEARLQFLTMLNIANGMMVNSNSIQTNRFEDYLDSVKVNIERFHQKSVEITNLNLPFDNKIEITSLSID